jgi:predicted RNA-binding protein with PUA-like domain
MAGTEKTGYWLFKQEPECYCYADLERDGRTVWDGVTNSLAQKNLRQVRVGDRILFYHTGKQKAVVGEMVVVGGPRPVSDGDKQVVVEVEPVRRLPAVTLEQIKADALLGDWELVRLPRLSVVPVSQAQWLRVEELSGTGRAE